MNSRRLLLKLQKAWSRTPLAREVGHGGGGARAPEPYKLRLVLELAQLPSTRFTRQHHRRRRRQQQQQQQRCVAFWPLSLYLGSPRDRRGPGVRSLPVTRITPQARLAPARRSVCSSIRSVTGPPTPFSTSSGGTPRPLITTSPLPSVRHILLEERYIPVPGKSSLTMTIIEPTRTTAAPSLSAAQAQPPAPSSTLPAPPAAEAQMTAGAPVEASEGPQLGPITLMSEIMKQIYCSGSLLEAVQKANIFHDCKHFVDMPLKVDAESTLHDWQNLIASGQLDEASLRHFVENHFDEPGGELDAFQPSDFDPECGKFESINCPSYRQWAKELHRKWPTLCRKVSDRVLADPGRYSLIPLPKPFVVPGGRFREMYYWDSFFTIKGLLASGMHETVRGMIENMGSLIERFGYVPNGNRVYYLNRSQPPLLTWCLAAYYEATGDKEFVLVGARWFEREYEFFRSHKSLQLPGVPSPLYRYHVIAAGPRPESYREDVESAHHIEDIIEKQRLWGDIAAAAESGRDFSSRWFSQEGPVAGKMGSTRTSSILPVDLNAIICGNLRLMATLYEVIGDMSSAEHCRRQFESMKSAIHQVFWNEECGCWFDYDIVRGCHFNVYMDTNFFPLFTGCTHDGFDPTAIVSYLTSTGVLAFPGGLPSSLIASGQQWDFPNAWAPTTWVVIQGLRASGQHELARQIAEKWIKRNYSMWLNSGGRMFEKYNVASQCFNTAGGGGEYEVQEGFGWTNGVILDLLLIYGPDLTFKSDDTLAIPDQECACCQKSQVADILAPVSADCNVQ